MFWGNAIDLSQTVKFGYIDLSVNSVAYVRLDCVQADLEVYCFYMEHDEWCQSEDKDEHVYQYLVMDINEKAVFSNFSFTQASDIWISYLFRLKWKIYFTSCMFMTSIYMSADIEM